MLVFLSLRLSECEEHGWVDLQEKVDGLIQSLIDTPDGAAKIRTALLMWCHEVDKRIKSLPMTEEEIIKLNPSMSNEVFGTET